VVRHHEAVPFLELFDAASHIHYDPHHLVAKDNWWGDFSIQNFPDV
jgi:hypothetical protein